MFARTSRAEPSRVESGSLTHWRKFSIISVASSANINYLTWWKFSQILVLFLGWLGSSPIQWLPDCSLNGRARRWRQLRNGRLVNATACVLRSLDSSQSRQLQTVFLGVYLSASSAEIRSESSRVEPLSCQSSWRHQRNMANALHRQADYGSKHRR